MDFNIFFEDEGEYYGSTYYKAKITNLKSGETRIIYVKHSLLSELNDKLADKSIHSLPSFPSKNAIIKMFSSDKETPMVEKLNNYFKALLAKPLSNDKPLLEFFNFQTDQLREYMLRKRIFFQYVDEFYKEITHLHRIPQRCTQFVKYYSVTFENRDYGLKRYTLPRAELSIKFCQSFVNMHLNIHDYSHIVKPQIIFQVKKRKDKKESHQTLQPVSSKTIQYPYPKRYHPYELMNLVQIQQSSETRLQYLISLEDIVDNSLEDDYLNRIEEKNQYKLETIIKIGRQISAALIQIHRVQNYSHRNVSLRNIFRCQDGNWRLGGAMEPIWMYVDRWNIQKEFIYEILMIPPERRTIHNQKDYNPFNDQFAQNGDIYQFGLSLIKIATLCNTNKMGSEQLEEQFIFQLLKQIDLVYGQHLSQFISSMVSMNPNDRPNAKEINNFFISMKQVNQYKEQFEPLELEDNDYKDQFKFK